MHPPDESRERLLDEILERAATDREFRRGLLERPKRTIFETFGVRVPKEYRILFLERDPEYDSVVILPDFRDEMAELSDDDLEDVAGGTPGSPPTW